jgi:hypothetical protein
MQGTTARLSLIFPASGDAPVCSALAWPDLNSLLRSPTGVTVEVTVAAVAKEGMPNKPPRPVVAKVLECLRWSILKRVEHLGHAAIQHEMRATADSPGSRWLRLVAEGVRGDGTLTLTVNVQHHLAYQALAVALLHPPRDGFKVHQEPLWYSIRLADSAPLMQLLAAPRAKGAAAAMQPPSEPQLITRSFVEAAFRGSETKAATFAPHFPNPSKTRWHVALETSGRNPLAAPAPATGMWAEGTCVYDPADGRFVLTLTADPRRPVAAAPFAGKKRGPEAGDGGEERWVMIDDFGTLERLGPKQ